MPTCSKCYTEQPRKKMVKSKFTGAWYCYEFFACDTRMQAGQAIYELGHEYILEAANAD